MSIKTGGDIEAVNRLRALLKPDDTVYTVLRTVARSGLSRTIGVFMVDGGRIRDITRLTARACGLTMNQAGDGVRVHGGGMDMGFWLVYELASSLFAGDSKGDPGYALKHAWL